MKKGKAKGEALRAGRNVIGSFRLVSQLEGCFVASVEHEAVL
jgi:hypothetical protein